MRQFHWVRAALAGLGAIVLAAAAPAVAAPRASDAGREGVPRFAHIVVIVAENKDYDQILDGVAAPRIAALAKRYGVATNFYGETHPSEPNYVALLGGDTFGIHDDDPWFCKPGTTDVRCPARAAPDYVDHTAHAPHLGDQLIAAGLTWRGYYEDIPAAGSLDYIAAPGGADPLNRANALYAAKHAGFTNYASTQADPARADHLTGFDRLAADLAANALPAFAFVVPNQCNEMHGLVGAGVPPDCAIANLAGLIGRGDAHIADLVARIQATPAWRSKTNFAIVITFDEGAKGGREGCCGATSADGPFLGGGHIPTVVITNHGPHGLADPTAYNHYSLLRTIEDAFGVPDHLRHAGDDRHGVKPMVKLFGG